MPRAKTMASYCEADRTVRVANLTPSTPDAIESGILSLLLQARIGMPLRMSAPLDNSKVTIGTKSVFDKITKSVKRVQVRKEEKTKLSSRAFIVFAKHDRAVRAVQYLDGLKVGEAILQATLLGRAAEVAAQPKTAGPSDSDAVDLTDAGHFPSLPEPAPARDAIVAPRPPPRACGLPSDDALSDAISAAPTTELVCSYCRCEGHVVRCRGVICCPRLAMKEEAALALKEEEEQARIQRARDRALERMLLWRDRELEKELTGWTTVGRAAILPSPAADDDTADDEAPISQGQDLSRAQKRMQRRKEKRRAKRAAEAEQ